MHVMALVEMAQKLQELLKGSSFQQRELDLGCFLLLITSTNVRRNLYRYGVYARRREDETSNYGIDNIYPSQLAKEIILAYIAIGLNNLDEHVFSDERLLYRGPSEPYWVLTSDEAGKKTTSKLFLNYKGVVLPSGASLKVEQSSLKFYSPEGPPQVLSLQVSMIALFLYDKKLIAKFAGADRLFASEGVTSTQQAASSSVQINYEPLSNLPSNSTLGAYPFSLLLYFADLGTGNVRGRISKAKAKAREANHPMPFRTTPIGAGIDFSTFFTAEVVDCILVRSPNIQPATDIDVTPYKVKYALPSPERTLQQSTSSQATLTPLAAPGEATSSQVTQASFSVPGGAASFPFDNVALGVLEHAAFSSFTHGPFSAPGEAAASHVGQPLPPVQPPLPELGAGALAAQPQAFFSDPFNTGAIHPHPSFNIVQSSSSGGTRIAQPRDFRVDTNRSSAFLVHHPDPADALSVGVGRSPSMTEPEYRGAAASERGFWSYRDRDRDRERGFLSSDAPSPRLRARSRSPLVWSSDDALYPRSRSRSPRG